MNFRVEARGAGPLDENKRSGSERGTRGECRLRRMAGVGLEIVEERHDIGRVGEKSGRRVEEEESGRRREWKGSSVVLIVARVFPNKLRPWWSTGAATSEFRNVGRRSRKSLRIRLAKCALMSSLLQTLISPNSAADRE